VHFSHVCNGTAQTPFNSVFRYRRKDSFEVNPLCSLSLSLCFCDRNFSSPLVYSFFCFPLAFICETTFSVIHLYSTVPCTSFCSRLSRSPHASQCHLSLQIYLNVFCVYVQAPRPPRPAPPVMQVCLRYNAPSRDMIPYTTDRDKTLRQS